MSDPDTTLFHYLLGPSTVAPTTLSLRQIGRMLASKTRMPVTANTLLVAVGGQDWQAARSTPILAEICASDWYYQEGSEANGPVSCTDLVALSGQTRVYHAIQAPEWKPIQELPNLSTALEILRVETKVVQKKEDDLEDFLKETEKEMSVQDDEYESDGGTLYCKKEGEWQKNKPQPATKEAKKKEETEIKQQPSQPAPKPGKKRQRAKFSARNARNWIYLTGLPPDVTATELESHFSKVGLLDLDPLTQRPKIKIYRDDDKEDCKGDGSLCFARPESVDLAIQVLDEAPLRPSVDPSQQFPLRIERAKFEQHGETFEKRRRGISEAQRKVAKLATQQAMDWDEGHERLTGGRKGLKIIVLKNMFRPDRVDIEELERELASKCDAWGEVEKITIFRQNPEGVVIIKFAQPAAASEAVQEMNGATWKDLGRVEASFWDGVADFTVKTEEGPNEEQRHEEFGSWLDQQELPDDLRLQTED